MSTARVYQISPISHRCWPLSSDETSSWESPGPQQQGWHQRTVLCIPRLKALQRKTAWLGEQSMFCWLESTPRMLISLWSTARASRASITLRRPCPAQEQPPESIVELAWAVHGRRWAVCPRQSAEAGRCSPDGPLPSSASGDLEQGLLSYL